MRRRKADCRRMPLSLYWLQFEMFIGCASGDVTGLLGIWVWKVGERSQVEICKLSAL